MIRQSSIDAYREAQESGLVAQCQILVLETVFNHHPVTANEVLDILYQQNQRVSQNTINTRFSELEGMGLIKTVERKQDKVTGKLNNAWVPCPEFSDEQIQAYKQARQQAVKERQSNVARLEAECANLRAEVQRLSRHATVSTAFTPVAAPAAGAQRYELYAKDKPGMTVSSLERAKSEKMMLFYCEAFQVPMIQVKIRKLAVIPE
jgi:Fe2+ or Zn2+ uptake regulation protein